MNSTTTVRSVHISYVDLSTAITIAIMLPPSQPYATAAAAAAAAEAATAVQDTLLYSY
jgi:hypothetical protein